MEKQYTSFAEFYPFYLQEHSKSSTRRLHFVGTALFLVSLAWISLSGSWESWWVLPLVGYGFAWIGHFFFEKNRPATFTYPFYSLCGDFMMFKDMLTGKMKW